MRTIHKYAIPAQEPSFIIGLPELSEIVHIAMQGETPNFWARVDTEKEVLLRTFAVLGTGHEIPKGWLYHGTWQSPPFVWHLFEVPR